MVESSQTIFLDKVHGFWLVPDRESECQRRGRRQSSHRSISLRLDQSSSKFEKTSCHYGRVHVQNPHRIHQSRQRRSCLPGTNSRADGFRLHRAAVPLRPCRPCLDLVRHPPTWLRLPNRLLCYKVINVSAKKPFIRRYIATEVPCSTLVPRDGIQDSKKAYSQPVERRCLKTSARIAPSANSDEQSSIRIIRNRENVSIENRLRQDICRATELSIVIIMDD